MLSATTKPSREDPVVTEQQLKRVLADLTGGLDTLVQCRVASPATDTRTPVFSNTQCTIEYRNVTLAQIPQITHAASSRAQSQALSLSTLTAKAQQRDTDASDWCSVHVELQDASAATASVRFTRSVCALVGDCELRESASFAIVRSGAENDEVLAVRALRSVSVPGESVERARVLWTSEDAHRGVLIVDLPCSLAFELGVKSVVSVKLWVLSQQLLVRALTAHLAMLAASSFRVYSIAFATYTLNSLEAVLRQVPPVESSSPAKGAQDPAQASAAFDVLVQPNYRNLRLSSPSKLVVREADAVRTNLSQVEVSLPWRRRRRTEEYSQLVSMATASEERLRWSIRSRRVFLVYDIFSRPTHSSVVHSQVSPTELEMRGSIADLEASMAAVSLGLSSDLLRDKSAFTATIAHQVVQLSSILRATRSRSQTLSTPSTDLAVAGSFELAATVQTGFYSALNASLSVDVTCTSAAIQPSDTESAIEAKLLTMGCGASLPADVALQREIQQLRVRAAFPFQVTDISGFFSIEYLGVKTTTPVAVGLANSAVMRAKLLEVIADPQLEVSRVDSSDGRSFEWRVTFGAAFGRASGVLLATPIGTSAPFTVESTATQKGLKASDVTLGLLFPTATVRVRKTAAPAPSPALSMVFSFGNAPHSFPDLALHRSSLESSVSHLPLIVTLSSSQAEACASLRPNAGTTFRLAVFGRVTEPIALDADAAHVEAAIQRLRVAALGLLTVQRVQSFGICGIELFDWLIEGSHPSALDIHVVLSDEQQEPTASSSPAVDVVVTRVSRGEELLVAADTLSLSVRTIEGSESLARVDVSIEIEKRDADLAVRVAHPLVRVQRNNVVSIDGVSLDGFEVTLLLEIESEFGGLLALVPTRTLTRQPGSGDNDNNSNIDDRSKPRAAVDAHEHANATKLVRRGTLSELNAMLRDHRIVYTSAQQRPVDTDRIMFRLQSSNSKAVGAIAVEIASPVEAPSLALPASLVTATEGEEITICGLQLSDSSLELTADGNEYQATLVRTDNSHLVRVHIRASTGFLTFRSSRWDPVRAEEAAQSLDGAWQREVELTGSRVSVNAELQHLRYVFPASVSDHTTAVEDDDITVATYALKDDVDLSLTSAAASTAMAPPRAFRFPVKITTRPATARVLFRGRVLSTWRHDSGVRWPSESVCVKSGRQESLTHAFPSLSVAL